MSNDIAEVKIEKDNGLLKRWGKGAFYRQEGHKLKIKIELVKKVFISISIIIAVIFLFKEPHQKILNERPEISTPLTIETNNQAIELESYNDLKEEKTKRKKIKIIKVKPLKIVARKEKSTIPLGLSVKAKLLTGATNGPVKAQLLEDVSLNSEVFIKEGSIIWGQGTSTQERLLVSFSKFVDSYGHAHEINANAYDFSDQILGLKGSVIGRTSKKILAGAGLGVAGALQTMQQSQNMGGVAIVKPSLSNALLNGASSATLGIAEQELEELKNQQSIIEVAKDTEIIIIFGEL